ncbi:GNAT family N-acetyltransferase [Deinococcus sp. QL22]|uniref:GNAT family N-acetyltransferase n=1 Tax=Deinococcus sp. QL22 TaxID=2939437 RepID=UPI0020174EF0|nr:GNAT family N-acetyltransferase [Deinococcus sp. QL22]UQN06040.1 GNAT family N-acetyltransferase [Deinococcus sp. QL22]
MPQVFIRRARYSDLPELQILYKQLSPTSPQLSPERADPIWQVMLNDSKIHVLVAEQGGLWGTATLVVMPNLTQNGRPYALIENVVTHVEKRGQGIGKAVMAAAMALARSLGAYKVMLVTGRQAPEVHRLYAGSGLRSDAVAYFTRLEPDTVT